MKKINSYYLSCPIYGILLWQLEPTNTATETEMGAAGGSGQELGSGYIFKVDSAEFPEAWEGGQLDRVKL